MPPRIRQLLRSPAYFALVCCAAIGLLALGEVVRAFSGGAFPADDELLAFLRARWRPGDRLVIQPELPPDRWKRFAEFPIVGDQPPLGERLTEGGRVIVASYLAQPRLAADIWNVDSVGPVERAGAWRIAFFRSRSKAGARLDLRALIPRIELRVSDNGKAMPVRPFNGESFVGARDEWLVRRRVLPLKGRSEQVWSVRLARGREMQLRFPPTPRAKQLWIRLGFSDRLIAKKRGGAARIEIWVDGRWLRNVEPWNRVGFWTHRVPLSKKGTGPQRLELRVREVRVDRPLALLVQAALEY